METDKHVLGGGRKTHGAEEKDSKRPTGTNNFLWKILCCRDEESLLGMVNTGIHMNWNHVFLLCVENVFMIWTTDFAWARTSVVYLIQ